MGGDFTASSDLTDELHIKLHFEVIELCNIGRVGDRDHQTLFSFLQRDKIVADG